MGSSMLDENQIPVDVQVDDSMIRIRFSGGLELATPVSRFPRLKDAEPSQRIRWELIGRGQGIHWPDVDEDISIRGLFATARPMPESAVEQVPVLISDLLKTTGRLNTLFPGRPFTPDGHLVGSIGEVVAEHIYDLRLAPCSTPQIDAYTRDQRSVQVKLTGEKGQTFGIRWPVQSGVGVPEILLCLKMTVDGFVEIYNGPFPTELLEGKSSSNGQVALGLRKLSELNPHLLPKIRSFESINRWFQSTPELAEVA
jgi:hypothetical protein